MDYQFGSKTMNTKHKAPIRKTMEMTNPGGIPISMGRERGRETEANAQLVIDRDAPPEC
jgi:hypothetical protein